FDGRRKLQAGVQNQFRLTADGIADKPGAVAVANRYHIEIRQAGGPSSRQGGRCVLVAETRRVGNKSASVDAAAIEDGMITIPGMSQIPHLVAANDDQVPPARHICSIEIESVRSRE